MSLLEVDDDDVEIVSKSVAPSKQLQHSGLKKKSDKKVARKPKIESKLKPAKSKSQTSGTTQRDRFAANMKACASTANDQKCSTPTGESSSFYYRAKRQCDEFQSFLNEEGNTPDTWDKKLGSKGSTSALLIQFGDIQKAYPSSKEMKSTSSSSNSRRRSSTSRSRHSSASSSISSVSRSRFNDWANVASMASKPFKEIDSVSNRFNRDLVTHLILFANKRREIAVQQRNVGHWSYAQKLCAHAKSISSVSQVVFVCVA